MRAALACLALAACQPAHAAVYGPPAPLPDRVTFDVAPHETIEQAEDRIRRDSGNAWRKFWIAQGLAGADIALTCIALAQRNPDGTRRFREGNPIYGRDASCGRVVAIRAGISALQYVLVRRAIESDPRKASRRMTIMIAVQGVPVVWNAIQLAK